MLLNEVLIKTGNLTGAESDLPECRLNSGTPDDAVSPEQCSHYRCLNNVFVHAVGLWPLEHLG
jgi:hypothetical protein